MQRLLLQTRHSQFTSKSVDDRIILIESSFIWCKRKIVITRKVCIPKSIKIFAVSIECHISDGEKHFAKRIITWKDCFFFHTRHFFWNWVCRSWHIGFILPSIVISLDNLVSFHLMVKLKLCVTLRILSPVALHWAVSLFAPKITKPTVKHRYCGIHLKLTIPYRTWYVPRLRSLAGI